MGDTTERQRPPEERESAQRPGEALADIARLLTVSMEPRVVAQRIVDKILALLGARNAAVYRLEAESGNLEGVAFAGDFGPPLGRGLILPKGTGAVGVALSERKAVVTPDFLADPRVTLTPEARAHMAQAGNRSVLAVPLVVGGRVIGALSVGDQLGKIFDNNEIRLAQAFADQAAIALENAQLYGEAERRRQEAEIVAELARDISASLDLDVILKRVAEGAKELCGSDLARIALKEGESEAMIVRYTVGSRYRDYETLRIEAGKGVGGQVLVTGRPFRTDHCTEDSRITKDYLAVSREESVIAELAVPILIGNRVEGLLFVHNRSPRSFTQRDEAILSRLADHAGIAIRNVQLLAREQAARAEAEAAERRFRSLVHGLDAIVWAADAARLQFTFVNRRAEGILGYPVKRWLTKRDFWANLIHPDDREGAIAFSRRATAEGGDHDFEYRAVGADGREVWLHDIVHLVKDPAGHPLQLRGLMVDVTARKHAEQALRESEETFRTLADTAPVLVWMSDVDGQRTFFSQPWFDFTRRSREQELGSGWSEGVHPDDLPRYSWTYRSASDARERFTVEYRLRTADGRYRWIVDSATPRWTPNGHFTGYIGCCLDITERKGTEEQLEARARRQAAVAELGQWALAGMDGSALMDAAVRVVCEALRMEYCKVLELAANRRTLHLRAGVGWKEGLVGHATLNAERDSQAGYALLSREPVMVEDFGAQTRFRPTPLLEEHGIVSGLSVVIQGAEDQPYGVLGAHSASRKTFTRDDVHFLQSVAQVLAVTITRKHAEAERAQLLSREQAARAEAEAANRAKDEFLAMLSHELRNPIGAISNAVAVLEHQGSAGEGHDEVHAIIARQTQQLAHLLDDLLDVARLAAGKVVIRWRPVELHGVAERCVEAFRQLGRTTQHDLSLSADPVMVKGDPARLEQVLSNLLENSVKYTPPGGRIRITVRREGPQAVLRVHDTGVGIEGEMLARIFELFTQGTRSLDRSGGGLGVGLTVARRLVELHRGTLEAFSAGRGRGSEFVVRLPRLTVQPDSPTIPPRVHATRRLRILVVEDNEDARKTLRKLLEIKGHEVDEAEEGACGAEKALAWRPDVALIDIGLPGVDGYAMARQVRAAQGADRMLLVALTGYGDAEDRRLAVEAGFDAHLVKPVKLDELSGLLEEAARGKPAPDA